VLAVAQGLVATPRRTRISIPEARRRLEAAASPPPDQDPAVEHKCVICLSAPRSVRFGCGHATLCDGCLGPFLARQEHARCPHCRAAVVLEQIEQGSHVAQQDTFSLALDAAARGANVPGAVAAPRAGHFDRDAVLHAVLDALIPFEGLRAFCFMVLDALIPLPFEGPRAACFKVGYLAHKKTQPL
ncbi:hypothetical protein T484DRAFT_1785283, partial [Baffinella frigidus]